MGRNWITLIAVLVAQGATAFERIKKNQSTLVEAKLSPPTWR
jgi:hypothetical protein